MNTEIQRTTSFKLGISYRSFKEIDKKVIWQKLNLKKVFEKESINNILL